jgi:hypothetical protein
LSPTNAEFVSRSFREDALRFVRLDVLAQELEAHEHLARAEVDVVEPGHLVLAGLEAPGNAPSVTILSSP